MELNELMSFDNIIIQCHNNPDADAIACGFAMHQFFSQAGKKVRFIFGGKMPLDKPSLCKMVSYLNIPIEHIPEPGMISGADVPELLLLVDCQHGAGNVMPVQAEQVAVIDHHVPEGIQPELSTVRPDCGACAGLVRDLLLKAGYMPSRMVSTALHYGLYMDTQCFAELRNALDRDLLEEDDIDEEFLDSLKKNNLKLRDLDTASEALRCLDYNSERNCVTMHSPPCDPNLLGFLADLLLQVEEVDVGLVWQVDNDFIRYSVRSSTREVKASDLAAWLGSGGGHLRKAGGRLSMSALKKDHPDLWPAQYFQNRLREYFDHYEIIDCANFSGLDPQELTLHRKLPLTLGYVPCSEVFPEPCKIYVRMLESDVSFQANEKTYLMIGSTGEVYPISTATFQKSYICLDEPYSPDFTYMPKAAARPEQSPEFARTPSALSLHSGKNIDLRRHAKACKSKESRVWGKPLSRGVKVFSQWDPDQYMIGEVGDWLVGREDNLQDVYVVRQDIFVKTYTPAE